MSDAGFEISCIDVHKSFRAHDVLMGVNLNIERGEFVAVVGGSGCGKTVLLNLILSQLVPERGRILVANHALKGAPLTDLATPHQDMDRLHEHWGVVFQRNALFSGSVLDNIALWLTEVRHESDATVHEVAVRVLGEVGLPVSKAFLDTDHAALSGGMAKRLAVARALSMEPMVLFYDEPTTGLDPTSASQIQDLIQTTHERGSADNQTTLIITHDKDLLRRLKPRVVMLDKGVVFFDGSFEEFEANDSSVIRPYFDLMPVLHQRLVA